MSKDGAAKLAVGGFCLWLTAFLIAPAMLHGAIIALLGCSFIIVAAVRAPK